MRFTGITLLIVLGLLGCRHGHVATSPGTHPDAPSGSASASPDGGIAMGLAAEWDVNLDLAMQTASVSAKPARRGTDTDDLYLFPAESFFTSEHLRVSGIGQTDTELIFDVTIRHPFAPPSDPAGAASNTNRADLGIAGMLLLLADVPSAADHTYFTDVVLNTELVANADAYFRPRTLIPTSLTANTFPYKVLVDEQGEGSRIGISNGGIPTGNFGDDGWTRDELGPDRTGWTGYGILHQGQATRQTWRLNKSALTPGQPISFRLALIAKYNDPRGGTTPQEKQQNRLPSAAPFAQRFAYRMPHGALDIERIQVLHEAGGLVRGLKSSTRISVHLDDWDARATESTITPLADDPDPTHVGSGAAGLPNLAISMPELYGPVPFVEWTGASIVLPNDSLYGGDADPDFGSPGDALYYEPVLTLTPPPGAALQTIALLRASDPEASADIAFLDATLLPLSGERPAADVFQICPMSITDQRSFHGFRTWPRTELGDQGLGIEEMTVDQDGNIVFIGQANQVQDVDPGVGVVPLEGADAGYVIVKLSATGDFLKAAAIAAVGAGSDVRWAGPISVAPDNGLLITLMVWSGSVDVDPGPTVRLVTAADGMWNVCAVRLDRDLAYQWHAVLSAPAFAFNKAVKGAVDVNGQVYLAGGFDGTLDFDPGAGIAFATAAPSGSIFSLALSPAGEFRWLYSPEPNEGFFTALATSPTGGAVFAGSRGSRSYFTARHADGSARWVARFEGSEVYPQRLTIAANGDLFMSGDRPGGSSADVDFDPSPAVAMQHLDINHAMWLCALTQDAAYKWAVVLPIMSAGIMPRVEVSPCRGVLLTGTLFPIASGIDVDPGPGEVRLFPQQPIAMTLIQLNGQGQFQEAWMWDGAAAGPMALNHDCGLLLSGSTPVPNLDLSPDPAVVPYSSVTYGPGAYGAYLLQY